MAASFDSDNYFNTGEWKVAANSASSHYEKLGFRLSDTLSDKQIIEAFHLRHDWWTQYDRIARKGQAHPVIKDVGPFIQDAIKNLLEAKSILSDPVRKAQYDKILNDEIVRKTEEDLIRYIHYALQSDNMISKEEMSNLLNMADTLKIGRDKGKEIILYEMEKAGATFKPESDSGNTTSSSEIPLNVLLEKYYEILGVTEDDDDVQIRDAYERELKKTYKLGKKEKIDARRYELNKAYDFLKDPVKKRKYDDEQKRKRDKDLTTKGDPKLEIKDERGKERRNFEFKNMRLGTTQSVTVIARNVGGGTLDAKIKTSHPWLIVDTNKIHQSKLPQEITIAVDPKKNPKKNTFGGKDTGYIKINDTKGGSYTVNIAYTMVEDEADLKRFRYILTTIGLIIGFLFGLVVYNFIEGIEQNGLIIIAAFIGTISVSSIWGYKDTGGGGAIGWSIGTAVGVFIIFAILQAWFPHALLTVVWALIYGSVANILSDFIRRAIRQGNYQVPIGSGIGIIALTAMLIFIGTEGGKRFFNNPKKTYTVPQKSTDESERTIKLGDKIYNKSTLGFTTKLGFATRFITTQLQKSYGLRDNLGALAYDIEPNSPAEKAGIKSGDVIIKYNGNKIKDPLHLNRLITKTETYKGEEIVVIRDGKKLTLNTTILKLPKTSNEKVIKNTELGRQKTVNSTLNSSSLFANKNSRTYHKSNCPKLNTENLIEFTSSQKAQDAGGIPCEHCNPSAYAGKNAIKVGSSNILGITNHVQDSDKFDIHYRVYPSSFQEIWYVVNQQLNQQKEKSIQQSKGKGIIITDLTRHGIYGFPHYDKYYIVIEKLDRFSTKVNLKLFSYYRDMKDKKITDIVLLPDNKTFVNKRAKKFLGKITKALVKKY